MNFMVSDEGIPPVEGFPTFTALIRLFSSVDPLVIYEFVSVDEGLPTGSTAVRPLSTVNFLVLN